VSDQFAILTAMSGRVTVLLAGDVAWDEASVEAEVGMRLEAGDQIRTGANSTALVTFFEGSTIELNSNTEVSFQELSIVVETGSTTVSLEQTIGRTKNRVEKLIDPASRYELNTPSGAALVRGTEFIAEVFPDGTTGVTVTEGDTTIVAQGGRVVVNAGEHTGALPIEFTIKELPDGTIEVAVIEGSVTVVVQGEEVVVNAGEQTGIPPGGSASPPAPTPSGEGGGGGGEGGGGGGGGASRPKADFYAIPTSGKAPLTVQFYDSSTGRITAWLWEFGDDVLGTDKNPQHTYLSAGNYTVSLTVQNSRGSDIETKVDYVTVYPASGAVDTTVVTGTVE
jgi:PKD repeat protein